MFPLPSSYLAFRVPAASLTAWLAAFGHCDFDTMHINAEIRKISGLTHFIARSDMSFYESQASAERMQW